MTGYVFVKGNSNKMADILQTIQCSAITMWWAFSQIHIIDTPYLAREGKVWGVCCEFEFWCTSCCCHHSAVHNIMINQTMLKWHLTVFSHAFCWKKNLTVFLFKFPIWFTRVKLTISLYWFMLWLAARTWTNVDPVLWWCESSKIQSKYPATWFDFNTRHHLPWKWGDYSGSLFKFNSWNLIHWIMEYWHLKIWTIMYFLFDQACE